MRILVKIPVLFRRKRSFSRRTTAAKRNDEDKSPKNGWLAIAVAGVFALMILLVVINVRLLLSPTAAGKKTAPSDPPRSEFSYPAGANSASTLPDRICAPSSATTFDSKTNVPDANEPGRDAEIAHPIRKTNTKNASPELTPNSQISKSDVRKETSSELDKARHKKTTQTHVKHDSEKPEVNSKRYTVQVGAFTNPQIAQQQTLSWKSRGYDAVLRPVAMPKSGVIYRLSLGSFKSEKEADDLVKDLKAKGVTSFKLLVSN